MTTSFAQPFAQSWSLADSQMFLDIEQARPEYNAPEFHAWRTRYQAHNEVLAWAVGRHLLDQAARGQMAPIAHAAGRRMEFVDVWNTLARGADPAVALSDYYTPEVVARTLGRGFTQALTYDLDRDQAPLTAADLTARFTQQIETGTFSRFVMPDLYCFVTGSTHKVTFKEWQPTLMGLSPEHRMVPLTEDGPGHNLYKVTLPVPSGELLMADWFRIPAFTAIDDERERTVKEDINCVMGRVKRTQTSAELGFGCVSVGNSMPHAFQWQDQLRYGHAHEHPSAPNGRDLGSICTDLWWVTLIDRQVLEGLLARTMPMDEAKATVAAYVKDPSHNVRQAKVTPGTHHLYFAGSPHTFQTTFAAPEVPVDGMDIRFLLSAKPVTLVPKVERTPEPTVPVPAPSKGRRTPRPSR